MKRTIFTLSLIALLATGDLYAQLAKNSWIFGFGFTYPRFQSSNVHPKDGNYGGYLSIQRNFFEDVGLRLQAGYKHITGEAPDMHTNIIGGDLDALYYFDPCASVSPYMGLGVGVAACDPALTSGAPLPIESTTAAELNFLFGGEWRIGNNWNIKTEFGYHSLPAGVEGIVNNNRQGIFGSDADSYVTVDLGLQYYFSKGDPSKFCDLYDGLKVEVPEQNYPSLSDIEDLARKYAAHPTDIDYNRIEDIIKKYPCGGEANWVLVGVNFEFDKSKLLPESYPILDHAVEVLNENPNLTVEIQGHCDYVGSDQYNQKLSERRANAVKDYLVSKGISASRLTTIGYGKTKPIADNSTVIGRAKNRRVEFKVK